MNVKNDTNANDQSALLPAITESNPALTTTTLGLDNS